MSHTTTVNDNEVQFMDHQLHTERDTNARRFAADCERNHAAVDHVYPGPGDKVKVYLVDSADGGAAFRTPTGWTVVKTFVSSTGGVVVTCAPEVDA